MLLTPKQKLNLIKIIPNGIIWGFFGLLYVLLEYGLLGDSKVYPSTNNLYEFDISLLFITSGSFILGILIGIIKVVLIDQLFEKRTFWQKIVFKTALYLSSIILLSLFFSLLATSVRLELSPFHPAVIQSMMQYASNFAFWSIVIYAGVITMLSLFILEVSNYLGGNVFNNFLTGKYHHPQEEERIFMFLDMKSSTTIAEQLGHVEFSGYSTNTMLIQRMPSFRLQERFINMQGMRSLYLGIWKPD